MEYLFIGLLSITLLIGPWIWLIVLSSTVRQLRMQIEALAKQGVATRSVATEASATPEFTPLPSPISPPITPHPSPLTSPFEVPPPPRRSTPKPTRTRAEWEFLVGGKLLNRIGAVALVLGVLFFLKYAFDNNWIPEAARVAMGAVAGGILLFIAHKTNSKGMKVFAQGLVGAGLVVLYLSAYSTYGFYHLLPHPAAVGLMIGVTVISLWQAMKYDSLATGCLAAVGGILTPAFLSTGVMNTTGLFTYIALLDLGLFAIVISLKKWRTVGWIGIAGIVFWWMVWLDEMSIDERIADFPAPIFFALLLLALVVAYDVMLPRHSTKSIDGLGKTVFVGVLAILGSVMYVILNAFAIQSWLVGFSTLTIVFGAACFVANQRQGASASTSIYGLATLIAACMIPAHSDVGLMQLALIRGLIVCGFVFAIRPMSVVTPLIGGAAVAIAALFSFAGAHSDTYAYELVQFTPIMNLRFGAWFACGAAIYFSGQQMSGLSMRDYSALPSVLMVIGQLSLIAGLGVEAGDYAYDHSLNMQLWSDAWASYMSGVATTTAIVIGAVSLRILSDVVKLKNAAISSSIAFTVGVMLWMVFVLPYRPDEHYAFLLNVRAATAVVILAMTVLLIRIARVDSPLSIKVWKATLWLSVVAISFGLFSTESVWPYVVERTVAMKAQTWNIARDLLNKVHLILSSVWMIYAIVVVTIGFVFKSSAARIAGIALLGLSVLKIFLYDLSYLQQPYRIISFIVLGMILLLASFAFQKFKHLIIAGNEPTVSTEPDPA